MAENASPSQQTGTRAGYVTLMGAPNAGKSSLMNRFVGERLSIVTPKAQTTWSRVTGIVTEGSCQIIFLDTPGILDPRNLLEVSFVSSAATAIREADVLLVLLDPIHPLDAQRRDRIRESAAGTDAPILVVVNKVDAAPTEAVESEAEWGREHLSTEVHRVSALNGDGVAELLEAIRGHLPHGPFLYPPDEIASEPVRFFAAEMVRETVFEDFQQEIPYSVFCQVEEFRESRDPVYIGVNIYVERSSQKGMLIGEKGRAIRNLGIRSREKLEHFLGRPVYLDLWVKVLPKWRKKADHLRRLGFQLPEGHAPKS
jgi:GTPase